MLPYIYILNRPIPMYGLCMAVGLVVASAMALRRAKVAGRDVNSLIILIATILCCALVGAKLLYLLVSCDLREVVTALLHGDTSALGGGGLVFYGGVIGGMLGALLGGRLARAKLGDYVAPVVPCIPLGHAFGRLGCFFGGCCYGRPTDGPLGVSFAAAGVPGRVLPVQLYESLCDVLLFFLLLRCAKSERWRTLLLPLYLMGYAVMRFALEFLRGDEIRGGFAFLSVSQWISVLLFAACALWLRWRKRAA